MYDTLTHQPDPMSSIKGASILETSEPETIPDTKAPSSTPFFGPRRLVGFAKKPKKDKNKKNRWSKVQYDPSYHLRAKKTGMPDYMLDNLEALSGYDMSDVRVHRNSPLPAQIGAYSYAQGTNIYLGPNRECDLGHEAWHTVQKGRPTDRRTGKPADGINIIEVQSNEKEATKNGRRITQNQPNLRKTRKGKKTPKEVKETNIIQCFKRANYQDYITPQIGMTCGLRAIQGAILAHTNLQPPIDTGTSKALFSDIVRFAKEGGSLIGETPTAQGVVDIITQVKNSPTIKTHLPTNLRADVLSYSNRDEMRTHILTAQASPQTTLLFPYSSPEASEQPICGPIQRFIFPGAQGAHWGIINSLGTIIPDPTEVVRFNNPGTGNNNIKTLDRLYNANQALDGDVDLANIAKKLQISHYLPCVDTEAWADEIGMSKEEFKTLLRDTSTRPGTLPINLAGKLVRIEE